MEHFCVIGVLLLLLLSSCMPLVQAGKDKEEDKETPEPTMPSLPTVSPRPSPNPTSQPSTSVPTAEPTNGPTEAPSVPPSGAPSSLPTPPPSTISPAPTISPEPTVSPVIQPSAEPTTTYAPTDLPTEERPIVTVALPELKFVLDVTATDEEPLLDEQEVDTAVVAFLTFFFSQGFYREAFLFVALQTKLVDGADARQLRRHLQTQTDGDTGVVVMTLEVVDGVASYNPNVDSSNGNLAPVPTEDELSTILSAYFSLWGTDKLLEYFQDDGLPIVGVSQVSIDGDVILTGVQDGDRGGIDQQSPTNGDDDSHNSAAILAGSIVGAGVVVIVAVALFVRIRRRDKEYQRQHQLQQREVAIGGMDERLVVDSNSDNNKAATATKSNPKSSVQSMSGDEASLPPPPPPPTALTSSSIPAAYQEKTPNPYTSASYADSTAAASCDIMMTMGVSTKTTTEDDDDDNMDYDDDIVSESDGDIISVTESLHHHDQGPLFVDRTGAPGIPAATPPVATTGKSSVRQQQPVSHFQYDASRLDEVISNAKKQGQQHASSK